MKIRKEGINVQRFKNQKMVKIIALVLAVTFLLSVVAVFAGRPSAQAATNSSDIGFVDMQAIFAAHPETAKARTQLAQATSKAEKEFNAKKSGLNQEQQQALLQQYREQLAQKEQDLTGEVTKKIDSTIGEVAKSKGITVVLEKQNVFYGGTDITKDVINRAQGK